MNLRPELSDVATGAAAILARREGIRAVARSLWPNRHRVAAKDPR